MTPLRRRVQPGSDSGCSHRGVLLCATRARRCIEPGLAVTRTTLPSNYAATVIRLRGYDHHPDNKCCSGS